MLTQSWVAKISCVVLSVLSAGAACAQNYPTKPIRIVTSGVGGGNDFSARFLAQGISGPLGQQVVTENRSSGVIPGEIVSKATPDGYTLLVNGNTHWISPLITKAPYDPLRDFAPISMVDQSALVLVVHPSIAATSVKELIAIVKAKPGALNYASGATGASSHLAGELFKSAAGIDIKRIRYRGTGPALNALLAGEVHMQFSSATSVVPHVQSGRLKALAVTSAKPSAQFPDLPTVAASGLAGFEVVSTTAILAPAETPAAIVNRLNQEIVRLLKTPEAQDNFFKRGSEARGSTPQELAAFIKTDMNRMGKVIRDAGITAK